jgi:hypothetical protein
MQRVFGSLLQPPLSLLQLLLEPLLLLVYL